MHIYIYIYIYCSRSLAARKLVRASSEATETRCGNSLLPLLLPVVCFLAALLLLLLLQQQQPLLLGKWLHVGAVEDCVPQM